MDRTDEIRTTDSIIAELEELMAPGVEDYDGKTDPLRPYGPPRLNMIAPMTAPYIDDTDPGESMTDMRGYQSKAEIIANALASGQQLEDYRMAQHADTDWDDANPPPNPTARWDFDVFRAAELVQNLKEQLDNNKSVNNVNKNVNDTNKKEEKEEPPKGGVDKKTEKE